MRRSRTSARLLLAVALLEAGPMMVDARAELPRIVVFPAARDARFAELPAVTFRSLKSDDAATIRLYEHDGSLSTAALTALAHVFRDVSADQQVPIAPRLLQLVYKAAVHFGAPRVDVVSGYRTSGSDTSHHSVGEAVDFRLHEVAAGDLASYLRRLGRVGVGYYPRVSFVHLDVRDASYFWVNRARRGRRGWDRPLPRSHAVSKEAEWMPFWDLPWFEPVIEPVDSRSRARRLEALQRRRQRRRRR